MMFEKLDVVRVKLVHDSPSGYGGMIKEPKDVLEIMSRELSEYDREVFAVINLKNNGQVISVLNISLVSQGTLTASLVHPREVFKSAILSNANAIVLAHNHPSSDCSSPSKEDMEVTDRLVSAGRLLGIDVLDHVIIGGETGEIYSMMEHGTFPDMSGRSNQMLFERAAGPVCVPSRNDPGLIR